MRIIAWLFVWCATVLSGGCAIWEAEISNRGGYLDHVVDQHWLKADSKSMRALRAFAIQVSLARIASVSAKNESDRQLLAIRIGATTKRFLPVYACAFEKNPLAVPGAESDPCFYYDSAMVDYSTALFDLAMIALPIEDAKRLVNSAVGSVVNPINALEVIESLIAVGRYALKYGRVVGALYRDTIELEVQVWLATPEIDRRPLGVRVTRGQVEALRTIYDRKSDDLPAWIAMIAALRSQGLEPVPHDKFFGQLGALMRYLCDLITQKSTASNECKAGLPDSPLAELPLVGSLRMPIIGRMAATRGFRPSQQQSHKQQQEDGGPPKSQSGFVRNPGTLREGKIRLVDGQRIQQALCVDPPNGDFGSEQTKAALLAYKTEFYGRAFAPAESPVANDNEFADLSKAVRLRRTGPNRSIPTCSAAGFAGAADVAQRAKGGGP